jgi:hypothetical protein
VARTSAPCSYLERPALEHIYLVHRAPGAQLAFPGTVRHPDHDFIAATPDAIQDEHISVQVKFVGPYVARSWGAEGDSEEGVPLATIAQTHWEAGIWNADPDRKRIDEIRTVAFLGTDLRVFPYEPDPEFFASMLERAVSFWREHVEDDVMPIVTDRSVRDTLQKIYKDTTGEILEAGDLAEDLDREINRHRRWGNVERRAKHEKELLASSICMKIGEALGIETERYEATWRPQRGKVSYKDALDELRPDVTEPQLEKYRGDGYRVLRTKEKK